MPKQRLTDRQLMSGVTLTDLLHFVITGDTSQNPAGSSYKGNVEQLFDAFSAYTCTNPLVLDTVNSCTTGITINGNVVINGSATTINTEVIQSKDNNIVLNYSGTHLTAIGGGITLEDGVSDGVDSRIFTNSDGVWLFDPGLSASTGTIDTLSACTGVYTSNLYGCSPINVNSETIFNQNVTAQTITIAGGDKILGGASDVAINLSDSFGATPNTFSIVTDGGTYGANSAWLYGDETFSLEFGYTIVAGESIGFGAFGSGNTPGLFNAKEVTTHDNRLFSANSGNADKRSVFVGTRNSTMLSGVTNSVVLGGVGLSATQDDTVYVDNLNINTIGSGTSVINLGLDSSGNVVTGTTGGSGDNIYNADGTLESDRVVNVSGFSLTISGEAQNVLTVVGSGDTEPIFKVDGSSGELFSITDSLVGELFTVNDISGVPILKVFDDDRILMGSDLAPSLNTTVKLNPGTGLSTVYSLPMTSGYTGAWFDYTVTNTGGREAGTIMSVFSGNTAVFTEFGTTEIGDTSDIVFSVSADTTNAYLQVSAATTGWEVKTIVRSI